MYILVSPFSKTFDTTGLIYSVPEDLYNELNIWCLVNVKIKDKSEVWLVLKKLWNDNLWIDANKIKTIESILNKNQFLSKNHIDLAYFVSNNYFSAIHNSVNLFFPTNLKTKISNWKIDLNKSREYSYKLNKNTLNQSQKEVFEKIVKSDDIDLFFWVTWSWKTHIYIELIKHYLDIWKQSLLLVPEIILTNQVAEKIRWIFWEDVIVLNSSVSEAKKTNYWVDIYTGKAKIIVWTRSALFYPYKSLWLIIVDEEHDNSYLSENSPRYNSIDIVVQMKKYFWCKVVLWSWTPSINSMYKSMNWDFRLLNLIEKYI